MIYFLGLVWLKFRFVYVFLSINCKIAWKVLIKRQRKAFKDKVERKWIKFSLLTTNDDRCQKEISLDFDSFVWCKCVCLFHFDKSLPKMFNRNVILILRLVNVVKKLCFLSFEWCFRTFAFLKEFRWGASTKFEYISTSLLPSSTLPSYNEITFAV